MILRACTLGLVLLSCLNGRAPAQDDGFKPMFNGKDLTGWVNVNCAPETFFVKNNMIITTGKPTGFLRTEKQYENFILEFEWIHMNTKEVGNSGLFVWGDPIPAAGTGYTRGIEVQVLVNLEKKDFYTSHGDIFSIWGAKCKPDRPHPNGWDRCLPSERRCKGGGEWNHYRVEARDGVIKLAVNGKFVSGVSKCNPRKGYLALESEGAECRFRNLKIKELPSTGPSANEVADLAMGHRALYVGDLRGWKRDKADEANWKPADWRLECNGKGKPLFTEKEYTNFELICDWRTLGKSDKDQQPVLLRIVKQGDLAGKNIYLAPSFAPRPKAQWSRTVYTVKGDRLTVVNNGKVELDNVANAVPAKKGPIGLGHVDEPIQFANILIRELE